MSISIKSKREQLVELGYDKAILFDNLLYDEAIIGVSLEGNVIYDYDKMVECLAKEDDIPLAEAVDFIDYDIIRAIPSMGEKAPIIINVIEDEKTNEISEDN